MRSSRRLLGKSYSTGEEFFRLRSRRIGPSRVLRDGTPIARTLSSSVWKSGFISAVSIDRFVNPSKISYHNQSSTQILIYPSLAPYERRVIELLRNSKDKRARKLAKKRVRLAPKAPLNIYHRSVPNTKYSSVPSAVPRRRSMSSSASSPSPAVPTKQPI